MTNSILRCTVSMVPMENTGGDMRETIGLLDQISRQKTGLRSN